MYLIFGKMKAVMKVCGLHLKTNKRLTWWKENGQEIRQDSSEDNFARERQKEWVCVRARVYVRVFVCERGMRNKTKSGKLHRRQFLECHWKYFLTDIKVRGKKFSPGTDSMKHLSVAKFDFCIALDLATKKNLAIKRKQNDSLIFKLVSVGL